MAPARSTLALVVLLALLAVSQVEAGRKRSKKQRVCNNPDPICQSDRFDVVFSHYDDYNCKVYKCQCRIPETTVCPQGSPQVKTDTHGCQYYECVSCPITQTGCLGTQVSVYRGDDANGCPQYSCQCPQNPQRPQCGSNEQLQSGTDSSGCPTFSCQQTRSQCPEKPQCSDRQELVSAGVIGDCEVYRCECLTPQAGSCPLGSQSRLQDDGFGCQEYRCVENRSPCPVQPTCPSPHQVVRQDGVDGNNCVKYVCECAPLATRECPTGYLMELQTDESCGCQFYRCEPNCEPKPTCSSAFQHAVVTATRSNTCPSYSCECKDPEVISCSASNAVLRLTVANDGSGCEVYICQTEDSNNRNGNCPLPTCSNPVSTGSLDSNGCPIVTCNGCPTPFCTDGSRPTITGSSGSCSTFVCQGSRSCGTMPNCPVGQSAQQVGFLSPGCPFYICQPTFCPTPNSCSQTQRPTVTADSRNCAIITCRAGNGQTCTTSPPICQNNEKITFVGQDANNCDEYVCVRNGCPQPPSCTVGERLLQTGTTGVCRSYICQPSSTRSCGAIPNCGNSQPQFTGNDAQGCPIYRCNFNRNGNSNCPVANCPAGQSAMSAGTDAFGCTQFMCTPNNNFNSGFRSGGLVSGNNCPQPPACPFGQQAITLNTDPFGCPVYAGCSSANSQVRGGMINGGMINRNSVIGTSSHASCPQPPSCRYQEFRVRSTQALGLQVCTVHTCVKLGQYDGTPKKCLDNPSYCDNSQTIETYVERTGYKGRKKCQRVECKGSNLNGIHVTY